MSSNATSEQATPVSPSRSMEAVEAVPTPASACALLSASLPTRSDGQVILDDNFRAPL